MTYRCFDCGCEVKPGVNVCPDCGGTKIEAIEYVAPPEKKSHPVLIILAILFVLFVLIPLLSP